METKIAIMENFFINPGTAYHIREISKLTKINHMTVGKYLKVLKNDAYLIIKESTPYNTYKADTASKKYVNLKRYYNLEKLRKSEIIDALEKEFDFPVIVLFGSYARAEDDSNSDIDIAIISEAKKEIDISQYEKKLKKKISIHLFNHKKWEETKKKNPELVNSICNGLVLSGQLEVL